MATQRRHYTKEFKVEAVRLLEIWGNVEVVDNGPLGDILVDGVGIFLRSWEKLAWSSGQILREFFDAKPTFN